MSELQVGDRIPEWTGTSHRGEPLSLTEFRGKQPLVVFFYPKDGTPVCTQEVCSFRDAYEDFVTAGAVVIGVSGDSSANHQAFAAQHRLPFHLVADEDGRLRKAFGVPKTFGILPGRATYVIDKDGTIRHIFRSQFAADRHVREALTTLRQLA